MRILVLALTCKKYEARFQAVRETWAARVPAAHELRFLGDTAIAEQDPRIWPCVPAGSQLDSYQALPIKVRDGFARALELPWDFLLKVDDDSYLHWERLERYVATLDPKRAIYVGCGYQVHATAANRDQWTELAGGDFDYHFGPAYLLSRPALEALWPRLDLALRREGLEDVIVGAVARLAGIESIAEPHLFYADAPYVDPIRGMTHGSYIVSVLDDPDKMRTLHRLVSDVPEDGLAVVSARVHWGTVGLRGDLGFDEGGGRVTVDGRPREAAISAHAPSRVVLMAERARPLRLRGALNATAISPEARVSFSVEALGGDVLCELGTAAPGAATALTEVRVPADGKLALVARTPHPHHCHSVWLLE